MQTFRSILSTTIQSAGLWEAYDLVGFGDTKITADDAPVQAVALNPATEIGLDIAGMLVGTIRLRARGAITKGDRLVSAAAGGVKTAGTGTNVFAVALSSAADGAFVNTFVTIR